MGWILPPLAGDVSTASIAARLKSADELPELPKEGVNPGAAREAFLETTCGEVYAVVTPEQQARLKREFRRLFGDNYRSSPAGGTGPAK